MQVTLIQKDLLEHTEVIVAKGNAKQIGEYLVYKEKEEGILHKVAFSENGVEVIRKADYESRIHLTSEGNSVIEIHSPYGVMKMDAVVESYRHVFNRYEVTYRIVQGKDTVTHQTMTWILE